MVATSGLGRKSIFASKVKCQTRRSANCERTIEDADNGTFQLQNLHPGLIRAQATGLDRHWTRSGEKDYDQQHYQAVVVGAGAAGLLAATRLAELGQQTLLVEKNRKPGVKILISGGTRCNLTHDCDERGIVAAFGSAGKFLHSPLAASRPRELVELFEAEGVPTYVEAGTGKIFPKSDRAVDVVAALVRRLNRSGATLALAEPAVDVRPTADGFQVVTPRRTIALRKTADHRRRAKLSRLRHDGRWLRLAGRAGPHDPPAPAGAGAADFGRSLDSRAVGHCLARRAGARRRSRAGGKRDAGRRPAARIAAGRTDRAADGTVVHAFRPVRARRRSTSAGP